MNNIIKGCLEVLNQGENFLNSITDESYKKIIKPFFISSSGEHMRHILDHFFVLKSGYKTGFIDYDRRRRGNNVEQQRSIAFLEIEQIKSWLTELDDNVLSQALTIHTEVAISTTLVAEVKSTLARELVFAASHAVHHYSTIATAIQMQDLKLDDNFGIAPTTASFLRRAGKSCVPSPG